MSSRQTADLYSQHHAERGRYGFTYGGLKSDRAQVLAKWIRSRDRLLDVGCRDGTLTEFLAGESVNVIGVDIDWQALARAAQRSLRVLWADVMRGLPFRDATFDTVNCAEILEHLPYPPIALAECNRVLARDGVLCGSVPNSFRLKNRLRFLMGREFELDPTHLHHFSPSDLATLLREAGFVDITLRFTESRFLRLHPRLMANDICFRARKP